MRTTLSPQFNGKAFRMCTILRPAAIALGIFAILISLNVEMGHAERRRTSGEVCRELTLSEQMEDSHSKIKRAKEAYDKKLQGLDDELLAIEARRNKEHQELRNRYERALARDDPEQLRSIVLAQLKREDERSKRLYERALDATLDQRKHLNTALEQLNVLTENFNHAVAQVWKNPFNRNIDLVGSAITSAVSDFNNFANDVSGSLNRIFNFGGTLPTSVFSPETARQLAEVGRPAPGFWQRLIERLKDSDKARADRVDRSNQLLRRLNRCASAGMAGVAAVGTFLNIHSRANAADNSVPSPDALCPAPPQSLPVCEPERPQPTKSPSDSPSQDSSGSTTTSQP